MFPSYISKLTITASTPILINELRKGKISFWGVFQTYSNELCFFANFTNFAIFIYNPGNNVRNKNPISVIQNENPYKQYKNNALDNVLAFGLSDGVRQEALHSAHFQDFFIIEIFQKIKIKLFGSKWTCESIQRDTKKIFLNYV